MARHKPRSLDIVVGKKLEHTIGTDVRPINAPRDISCTNLGSISSVDPTDRLESDVVYDP